jgi:hypothetical protein
MTEFTHTSNEAPQATAMKETLAKLEALRIKIEGDSEMTALNSACYCETIINDHNRLTAFQKGGKRHQADK